MGYSEAVGERRPLPENVRHKDKSSFSESLCHLVGFLVTTCVAVLLLAGVILIMVTNIGTTMNQPQEVNNGTMEADPAAIYNTRPEWQLGYLFLMFGCALTIASVLYFCWIAKNKHPVFGCWTIRALRAPEDYKIFDNIRKREQQHVQRMMNSSSHSKRSLSQFDAAAFDQVVATAPEMDFGEQSFVKNSTPRADSEAPTMKVTSETQTNVSLEDLRKPHNYRADATPQPSTSLVQEPDLKDSSSVRELEITEPSVTLTSSVETSQTRTTDIQETSSVKDAIVTSVILNSNVEDTDPGPTVLIQESAPRPTTYIKEKELGDTQVLKDEEEKTLGVTMDSQIDLPEYKTTAPVNTATETDANHVAVKVARTTREAPVEVTSLFTNTAGGAGQKKDHVYTMHIGEELKVDVGSPGESAGSPRQDLIYSSTAVQQVGQRTPSAAAVWATGSSAATVINLDEEATRGHTISVRVGEQDYNQIDTTTSLSQESTLIVRSIKHWQTKTMDFGTEELDDVDCDDTLTSSFAGALNDDVFLPPTPGVVSVDQHQKVTEEQVIIVQSPQTISQSLMTGPKSPITRPQSPAVAPQSPITVIQLPLKEVQSPPMVPQSTITGHKSPITGPQSRIAGPQSPIKGPKSPITGSQSPIATTITAVQLPPKDAQPQPKVPNSPITVPLHQPPPTVTQSQSITTQSSPMVHQSPPKEVQSPPIVPKLLKEAQSSIIVAQSQPMIPQSPPTAARSPETPAHHVANPQRSHAEKSVEKVLIYEPKSFTNAPTYEPYPNISTLERQQGSPISQTVPHTSATESVKSLTRRADVQTLGAAASELDDVYLTPTSLQTNLSRRSVRFASTEPDIIPTRQAETLSPWKAVKDIETPYMFLNKEEAAAVKRPKSSTEQHSEEQDVMAPLANPLFAEGEAPACSVITLHPEEITVSEQELNMHRNSGMRLQTHQVL